ncbi:MAG: beta-N-acetylhexosaminidase [Acholeplasmataceae bacterium]|nr:beta-N-acetylhexosaminidase [Acholeplasmataceae bacterium]
MIKITNLTLEEKIGQLLMVGFEGQTLSESTIDMIKKYKIGNIIHFTRNIGTTEQIFQLNKDLQKLIIETTGIPALISVDQEGGMVTRIYDKATVFPGAMTIAATDNENNAYLSGLYMGEELDALGFNMNFAPVLDVNNNPNNPVIGVRSFSDNPEKVSKYTKAFIDGLQNKVIATGKHFPGHGDTHVDSHLGLPRVDHSLTRLHEVELVPFKDAISNNIGAIMSAHIIYKITNDNLPATLSKNALTGLLREELKFEGLIVTDGMEMKAIWDNYGAEESAVPAILAGANMVLYCHYEDQQRRVCELIKEAVLNGTLPIEVLDERVSRILRVKQKLSTHIINQEYALVKDIVENDRHKTFSKTVVDKALTLVKGERFVQKGRTLFIGQLPKATTFADLTDGESSAIKTLKEALSDFEFMNVNVNPTDEEIKHAVNNAKQYKQVILTTYNSSSFPNQLKLINELVKLDLELHVVSLRNPYDTYYVPMIKNYICLYEYTLNSIETLKAYLLDNLIPEGKSPIHV